MDPQSGLKNSLNEILSNPETILESLLKNESFIPWIKKLTIENNLLDFLCKDNHPYKILRYALLDSVDVEDFKKIHSRCLTLLTTTYINDHLLKINFIGNAAFNELLTNFPKSDFLQNKKVCSNYSKIIEGLINDFSKYSEDLIYSNFGFLEDFILSHINILSFRELWIKLVVSFPEIVCKNESMFIKLIQFNSKDLNSLFFALQTVLNILTPKPSLASLMDNAEFGNLILKIGIDNYNKSPLISTQSFKIFIIIKESSSKEDYQEIIENTDFSFNSLNSATANALKLFPNNFENFIFPFFHFQCSTFLNENLVTSFRTLKRKEMEAIILKHHINHLIMQSFHCYMSTKINGHYLEFSNIVSDSKIVCCSEHETEWNLFVLQKLNPRRQQVNKKVEMKISTDKKFIHFSMLKPNLRPRK